MFYLFVFINHFVHFSYISLTLSLSLPTYILFITLQSWIALLENKISPVETLTLFHVLNRLCYFISSINEFIYLT